MRFARNHARSRHAFILGGTGQIGRAVADDLMASGWSVSIASRGLRMSPLARALPGARFVTVDREKPGELARALGHGADALIDITAYGTAHGRKLLEVQHNVGTLIVV